MIGITTHDIHERNLALAQRAVRALTEAEKPIADLSGIWLFGSVARNQDTEDSDVDLVVTHNGPEETFPFAFLDSVLEALELAEIPQGPARTRRSEKHPGTVQVETKSEALLQDPSSMPVERFLNPGFRMSAVSFWEKVRADAVKLWPE